MNTSFIRVYFLVSGWVTWNYVSCEKKMSVTPSRRAGNRLLDALLSTWSTRSAPLPAFRLPATLPPRQIVPGVPCPASLAVTAGPRRMKWRSIGRRHLVYARFGRSMRPTFDGRTAALETTAIFHCTTALAGNL